MNDKFAQLTWINNSGLGCFLTLLLLALLLGSVGLGWIVNGVLVFFAILLLLPIVGFWGVRWWISRKLVQSDCPACQYSFTAFSGTECNCPNCGEALQVQDRKFSRLTPPGTIEVEAIEVSAPQIED